MPQLDLETLTSVCGGGAGDRKIACETLAEVPPEKADVPFSAEKALPDFAPESFCLSKDAEFDWFDRNAFYERKDSGKGNSNSTNLNPNLNPSSNSSSQRFPRHQKPKASIIGLPKTQTTNYVDSKRRNCKPPNIRLFPKRSESVGKSASDAEPSSPKVSCMGRVRSKRGRRRSSETTQKQHQTKLEKVKTRDKQKTGFVSGLMAVFRRRLREKPIRSDVEKKETLMEYSLPRKSTTIKTKDMPVSVEATAIEPPSLGGMTKFSSGRRSWSAEEPTATEPPSLGGMTKFASGRRSWSAEDVDVRKTTDELFDLDRRLGKE